MTKTKMLSVPRSLGRLGLHILLKTSLMLICFADHFMNYWTMSV